MRSKDVQDLLHKLKLSYKRMLRSLKMRLRESDLRTWNCLKRTETWNLRKTNKTLIWSRWERNMTFWKAKYNTWITRNTIC
jgi:hypothetical protein